MFARVVVSLIVWSFLATSHAFASDSLSGYWTGTWTKSGDPLAVAVTFAHGATGFSGEFSSDDLQATGIPFSEITFTPPKVHFVLKGDTTTAVFDGEIHDDEFAGTFIDGKDKGEFRLKHIPHAKRGAQPLAHDVLFKNGDDTIAGSLLTPAGQGQHAAILFLHGSGAEGRFASRYLAEKFAAAGFVALITDKRGVGASTGDWKTAGFDDLAADAVAGIRFLQAQPEVDPKRIGIYGHSQGGTIAPLVANKAGDLAFVIGSAASGVTPAETEIYSLENSLGVKTLPPKEAADARAFVRAIVDVAYNGKPRATLDALAKRFKGRAWYFDPPPPDNYYWAFSRRIASYRPIDQWKRVTAPVLLLYGALDERVPPDASASAISAVLNPHDVTVNIIPGADHSFHIAGPPGGWQKRMPGYADMMATWAKSKTAVPPTAH